MRTLKRLNPNKQQLEEEEDTIDWPVRRGLVDFN
jgi:hypothetical protein